MWFCWNWIRSEERRVGKEGRCVEVATQAEDGIRGGHVTGVQTCALPIYEGWMVDIEKAHEESVRTGKPIMANFTGSDWCGWCKRLTASVFSKQEFKDWAEDNVVLLELDFPRRMKLPEEIQQQNHSLQRDR